MTYTGTKGETPDTDKVGPSELPRQLSTLPRILRILRFYAHDLNLKPSVTVYKRKVRGGKIPLRFTKSNDKKLEEAYARHFIVVGKLGAHQAGQPLAKSGAAES
jgi:hypothetical protein